MKGARSHGGPTGRPKGRSPDRTPARAPEARLLRRVERALATALPASPLREALLPAAIGFAAGIGARFAGTPAALGVVLALTCAAMCAARLRALRRPVRLGRGAAAWREVRSSGATRRRRWRLAAIALLALAGGQLRAALWEARPDPLAALAAAGERSEWRGTSDGRTLRLDDPAGARVALSPAGAVVPGRASVRGSLRRPSRARTPGGFDDAAYLRRDGIAWRLDVAEVLEHAPPRAPRARLLGRMVARLEARFEPEVAALLAAMTLGVRDDLGALRERFAAAGLAHVLALSGLHVGVVLGAAGLALRRFGRLRAPLLLAVLALFVLLVGPTPSVARAATMAGAVVATSALGERLEPGPALGAAALAGLALHPAWLLDLGFQLSYLSVLGLLLLAGPLTRGASWALTGGRRARLPRRDPRLWLAASLAASVAAQVYTLPIVFAAFGRVALFSPPVNALGVPLASLLVPFGLASALLGALPGPLVWLPDLASRPAAEALLAVAARAAHGPQLVWGEIRPPGALVYTLACAALTVWLRGAWRAASALPVLLVALAYGALPAPGPPEVIALDVGQGDATLVRLPGRREVLIDGGGTPFGDFDVGARTVVPALRALGAEALEAVVATHADADHIEGLASVLRALPVGVLVVGADEPGSALYRALLDAAAERGVPVRAVRRGERFALGGAEFEVLHPGADAAASVAAGANRNDASVALLMRWHGRPAALFLGDNGAAVERRLALPPTPLLLAAHHGSPHSTSAELVAAARPRVALVSVGRNRYGHPAPEVIARLERAGARVRTTHGEGTLRVALEPLLRDPRGAGTPAGAE